MVNRTNRGKGLTLSEILVSIVLLTLLLVTTLVLFTQLLTNTTKSGFVNTASVYADQILEEAIANPASSPPAFPGLLTGEAEFSVQGEEAPTKFVYRLEATELGSPSSAGERWLLEVEVQWWTDQVQDGHSRSGYGNLSTKQSRLVYVKWY